MKARTRGEEAVGMGGGGGGGGGGGALLPWSASLNLAHDEVKEDEGCEGPLGVVQPVPVVDRANAVCRERVHRPSRVVFVTEVLGDGWKKNAGEQCSG